jgi:small-conductance mechanosensitive channel
MAKRVIPSRAVDAYRRRRALRRYLQSIAYEVYDRNRTFELEELEGELLARRPDITSRLMKDLLMRTDALIQQLDRQVEALRARHGAELRDLRSEIQALRASLEALREPVQLQAPAPGADSPAQSTAGTPVGGD